jgi:hypothetical protein
MADRRTNARSPDERRTTPVLVSHGESGLLAVHVSLGPSVNALKRVDLTAEGRALFREWNKRWGDLTGTPHTRSVPDTPEETS